MDVGRAETAMTLPRTGRTVRLRDLTTADLPVLRQAFVNADPSVLRSRFGGAVPKFETLDRRVRALDGDESYAVAAFSPPGDVIGVAEYARTAAGTAEVAVIVARDWQREGIATALLHRLWEHARRHGITTATALLSGSNQQVLDVVRDIPMPHSIRYDNGAGELSVDLTAGTEVPATAGGSSHVR
jgi:GNAT superfamily N-acetyltransferase